MWAKTTPGERFEVLVELAKAHCKFSPNTTCARADKWTLQMTGGVHNEKGSINNHNNRTDTLFSRVATAFANGYGAEYILIINEVISFGSTMDHSLINPDKIHHFGTLV